MKIFLISFYCIYSSFLISQVPFYSWAGKIGSDSTDCTTMGASLSATSANSIALYASATATTFISTGMSYITPTLSTGIYTYYL